MMDTTRDTVDGITVIRLSGRLDANTSGPFEEELFGIIRDGDRRLILDFDSLEYMSSAGIRVLLKATREVQGEDGRLVLCGVRDYIRELFDLSGFDAVFDIETDPQTAAKGLLEQ